jgi:L,D-peptidoglycan transpeptidase YkuD (ErfK/YbiS/YcfS/YnhG family)
MKKRRPARQLVVRTLSPRSRTGLLELGGVRHKCALGRGGRKTLKCEGDGASPAAILALRCIYYRPDRVLRPRTALPVLALRRDDGWCDAPGDRNYNRPVRLPYAASAETMWRKDGLYDVVGVLAYNERPRVQGRGSAIFLHVARDGYLPTEGCIALRLPDLLRLLARLDRRAVMRIGR